MPFYLFPGSSLHFISSFKEFSDFCHFSQIVVVPLYGQFCRFYCGCHCFFICIWFACHLPCFVHNRLLALACLSHHESLVSMGIFLYTILWD